MDEEVLNEKEKWHSDVLSAVPSTSSFEADPNTCVTDNNQNSSTSKNICDVTDENHIKKTSEAQEHNNAETENADNQLGVIEVCWTWPSMDRPKVRDDQQKEVPVFTVNECDEIRPLLNCDEIGLERSKECGESPETRSLLPTLSRNSFASPIIVNSLLSQKFSNSLSSMGRPLCRICHLVHDLPHDPMIAPCRCSGTMQFVHTSCLVHWLEISAKKMCPSPRCELCGYYYKRHRCIDLKKLHLPHIEAHDVALNVVFIFVFFVMIVSAVLCVHFLKITDQYHAIRARRVSVAVMSNEDLTVIAYSIIFFAAFFIAIFTQYRAEASIFRVFFRFWLINRNWQIRNYDISDDPEMQNEKSARLQKDCTIA
ncbi:hypothetical protein AB6A40_002045 [Gnathostoma spinigerum]|uniref:RING-CH-type domain-containing protein n=1 Tax=Gnathostoma spinigerum TaxID=75299 RepID=A0ABD6E6W3_9BILA